MAALALELGNVSSRAEAGYDFDEFEIMKAQQTQQTTKHFPRHSAHHCGGPTSNW